MQKKDPPKKTYHDFHDDCVHANYILEYWPEM